MQIYISFVIEYRTLIRLAQKSRSLGLKVNLNQTFIDKQ
jgi:hypothetical protein